MFYEGRISTVFQLDKDEITSVISGNGNELKHVKRRDGTPQNATLYSDVLYIFDHNNKKYGFANDESTCEGITELAILDIDQMTQIESLTIGWVKGNKLTAILDCCDKPAINKKTGITLDENLQITSQPMSYYTCGCCGDGFKSTHKVQAKFDQDSGYGICPDCENGYL